jgi:endoglucanase Acf2
MTQDGQLELTDFLSKKIESKSVMDLTAWINSQGKAQYSQIGEVIEEVYNREKDSGELVERLTNAVSIYVLNQSMGYMNYLRKESEQ